MRQLNEATQWLKQGGIAEKLTFFAAVGLLLVLVGFTILEVTG